MSRTTPSSLLPGRPVVVPADAAVRAPAVSVVVPTYREAGNISELVTRLERVRESGIDLDLWLMDDRSNDGTREVIGELGRAWVRLVERDGPRGLSPAVLDGIAMSRGARVVVMDADLSHPVDVIPKLLGELDRGAEFAVGSRYVAGGGTEEGWGFLRQVNSRVATALARPLTSLKDPMSGFFAFERRLLDRAATLDPVGYKIGLELLVKCRVSRVVEVPIRFEQRHAGKSKLSAKQQVLYLQHLVRLYAFRVRGRA